MKAYVVTGSAVQIGAGARIGLSAAQYSPRAHRVDLLEKADKGVMICSPREPLDFKVGEVLLLADAPPKAVAEQLVPQDGSDDGRPRPALEAAKSAKGRKPAKAAA